MSPTSATSPSSIPATDDNPIIGIKVYRLRHTIMNPKPMAEGRNLLDPTLFVAFYQGEYDKDGKLLHTQTCTTRTATQVDCARTRSASGIMPIYYQTKTTRSPPAGHEAGGTGAGRLPDAARPAGHQQEALGTEQPDPNDSPWDDGAEKARP